MKLVSYPAAAWAAASPATPGRGMGGTPQPRGAPVTLGKCVVVAEGKGPPCAAIVSCPPALWWWVDVAILLGIR